MFGIWDCTYTLSSIMRRNLPESELPAEKSLNEPTEFPNMMVIKGNAAPAAIEVISETIFSIQLILSA